MTKSQIQEQLASAGIAFSSSASKSELEALLASMPAQVQNIASDDAFLNSLDAQALAMPFQGGLFTGVPVLSSKGELYTRFTDANGSDCMSVRFESTDGEQVTFVQANMTVKKLQALAHENSCTPAQLLDGRPVTFGVKVANNGWSTIHTQTFYSNEYSVANPNGQRVDKARLANRKKRFVRG